MRTHLIQPRELFGPEERQDELLTCWKKNEGVFDDYTHPEGRPTFTELIALCKPDHINVIANSDIYFETFRHYPPPGEIWCLSRWDVDPTGASVLWSHSDSQDVWIANGLFPAIDVPWTMGTPGVDNRLAWELENAGVRLRNPSKTVRSYHLHLSAYRSYLDGGNGQGRGGNKLERVPPPYALVKPTEL